MTDLAPDPKSVRRLTSWVASLSRAKRRLENIHDRGVRLAVVLVEFNLRTDGETSEDFPPVQHHGTPEFLGGESDNSVRRSLYGLGGDAAESTELMRVFDECGRVLKGVPPSVWDTLPTDDVVYISRDDGYWLRSVFALAWSGELPTFRAERRVWHDVYQCPLEDLPNLRQQAASRTRIWNRLTDNVPDPPDRWFAVIDDAVGASLEAIDVLLEIAQRHDGEPSPIRHGVSGDQSGNPGFVPRKEWLPLSVIVELCQVKNGGAKERLRLRLSRRKPKGTVSCNWMRTTDKDQAAQYWCDHDDVVTVINEWLESERKKS